MREEIMMREYQEADRQFLEDIIRETWNYDRFCSSRTAKKMANVYLNSCLANQTFTRVALVENTPVGIIMGNHIQEHKCPLNLRIKQLKSIISLYLSKEGRKVSKMFGGIEEIDKELLSACGKKYQGELAFFAVSEAYRGRGLGRKLFQAAVDYMRSQHIPSFFLFTDTSCNYPFYEHLGMKRCGEIKKVIHTELENREMTFFIYEYQI